MIKKAFSLLFAFSVFLSGAAFHSAGAVSFYVTENTSFAAGTEIIQNDIHFVKDYSKAISEVCRNFVNAISSIVSYFGLTGAASSFKSPAKAIFMTEAIAPASFTEKKINRAGFFFAAFYEKLISVPFCRGLFMLIFMFILWYIGLLRLFGGDHFFSKRIQI